MNPMPATILIVDDERQNRRLLEALLSPEGYATRCVASGREALASVAENAPDLILLDVMMPGMDGYEVARALKTDPATSSIPIIMVSAQVDRHARLAGLDAGAEEYLTKPVDRAELWLRVRNLLRLKALGDFLLNHSSILEQQVRERTSQLQRFRTAMDATTDAIFLTDRRTLRFVEVNATACAMLGYTREELLDLPPAALWPGTVETLEAMFDQVIARRDDTGLTEGQVRHRNGALIEIEFNQQAQQTPEGWLIVGVLRDITSRREADERLHHLAHFDTLTGLPNRTLFYQTLNRTLVTASEHGWQVAVMFIDLDNFKNVNDTQGHAVGDELLRQISHRLVKCLRTRDVVGRLGGDEFALILIMNDCHQGAGVVARKIRQVLQPAFRLMDKNLAITVSIGITVFPDDATDSETLIKYADTAMYRAKQSGRDNACFFVTQMNIDVLRRIELEGALRQAIDNDEFVLHYQPKVDVSTGKICGVEALLRWQRPGHGLVSPGEFIPVLEETGLIVRVGSWVIAMACRQIGEWLRGEVGPVQVSVNVSGRQFVEGNLEQDVTRALELNRISADLLELELTESSLMTNTDRTIATLDSLRRRGMKVSIDDFGTGYSSLAYLRRFPIDKLKIDIAFVRDITLSADGATIALAIIGMAHALKMSVIAEGVETEAQLAFLRAHGCDVMQGYYFSRPLPAGDMGPLLIAQGEAVAS